MVTRKDRRHSGHVTPRATVSRKELMRYSLFLNTFYDDWQDCRDSFRDWYRDFKKIKRISRDVVCFNEEMYQKRIRMNMKQRKLSRRRKARRSMERWKD